MDEAAMRGLIPEYLLGTLDPDLATEVETALAASPALRREAEATGEVLFALPEALPAEPVSGRVWTDLRSAVVEDRAAGRGSHRGVGPRIATVRSRFSAMALALAASLVLLTGTGIWGYRSAQEQARIAGEQRVIAYWMRNPNLRIVALDGVGPGTRAAGRRSSEIPPGIVCVLPDGRAMLLQPYDPPRGSRYVLYGMTDAGAVELGTTDGRFLLFEAGALHGVEVAIEGRRDAVVAQARF